MTTLIDRRISWLEDISPTHVRDFIEVDVHFDDIFVEFEALKCRLEKKPSFIEITAKLFS